MLGGSHTQYQPLTRRWISTPPALVLGSGANRQLIEGALAHRHGLQGLLPDGHPYQSIAP
jgi:hypothetical protein